MNREGILLLFVTFLGACDIIACEGPGGPLGPVELADAEYELQTLFQSNDSLSFGAAQDLSMVVDRAAGTVTLSYQKEGESVQEVWRITSSEFIGG